MAAEAKKSYGDKAAVLAAMGDHPALKALVTGKADGLLAARFDLGELTLTVAPGDLRAALATLRAAGYNAFEDMTAVDWFPSEPRFQLSYHVLSHVFRERIRLCAWVSGLNPVVESVTAVWPGANYYEREVFDLFGVRFEGHPNLRRILMPEEWTGYPMRKDYPVEGYR